MSSRRVENEPELVAMLSRHGFEVVDPQGLSSREQLELFGSVAAIVAIDDEILANLVVSPQGAKIGVIVANGIYRPRAYLVSSQVGHDFTYLQADPSFDSNPVHAECDVVLPATSLERWLSRL
jgi:capsular polysaccharide biosynthesis protein